MTDSDEQMLRLKEAFAIFDKEDDGKVNAGDIGIILRSVGVDATDAKIQSLTSQMGLDSNSKVDFSTLLSLMSILKDATDSGGDLKEVFKLFDEDGDGLINATELAGALKSLGSELSEAEAEEVFRGADADGDGRINYQEFVQSMPKQ
ncbi:MAG: hypothetical protein J3Q66DRAFT_353745 [Benniella sp.]|nr:MAG: hypothetical protein J3Q66DRAFT_353745 [Benniella sp.]